LIVGVVHWVIDGSDAVSRGVSLAWRQVGSQNGIVQSIQIYWHRMEAFVVEPNLDNNKNRIENFMKRHFRMSLYQGDMANCNLAELSWRIFTKVLRNILPHQSKRKATVSERKKMLCETR
jgi:hypothetical protein